MPFFQSLRPFDEFKLEKVLVSLGNFVLVKNYYQSVNLDLRPRRKLTTVK